MLFLIISFKKSSSEGVTRIALKHLCSDNKARLLTAVVTLWIQTFYQRVTNISTFSRIGK